MSWAIDIAQRIALYKLPVYWSSLCFRLLLGLT